MRLDLGAVETRQRERVVLRRVPRLPEAVRDTTIARRAMPGSSKKENAKIESGPTGKTIPCQRAQDAKTRDAMAQDAATRRLATAADGARRAGRDAAKEPSETASQGGRGLEATLQANSEERAAEITRGSERATPPCSYQALTPGEGDDKWSV